MRLFKIARRITGRGKVYAALAAIAGAAAVLFYLEHLAILYISGAVLLFVLLILATFSDLEEASIHASEEAYMTWKSEGAFEESAAILNERAKDNEAGRQMRRRTGVVTGGKSN